MKERLRELMRLHCRQANKPVEFASGCREILMVATEMQRAMVDLNHKTDVMMAACRAGGWFAYLPDHSGALARADAQDWAKALPEAAGRVSSACLASRYNWLLDGKPTLKQKADADKPELPDWHADHDMPPDAPGEDDVMIDMPLADNYLTPDELEATRLLLLHPKVRDQDPLFAEAGKLTMAKRSKADQDAEQTLKAKHRTAKKRARSRLAKEWRVVVANIGGPRKRLSQMIPAVALGKKQRKQQKKATKPAYKLAKKAQQQMKPTQMKKQALKMFRARAAQAVALQSPALPASGGALEGKEVRLVEPGLPELLRNTTASVLKHFVDGRCLVKCLSGTERVFAEADLYLLTGKEKLPLPSKAADMRRVPGWLRERACTECGGQATPYAKLFKII